jgi:hypothetical protein
LCLLGFYFALMSFRLRPISEWTRVPFVRAWLAGGITGFGTGLSFILVSRVLSADLEFELWEFALTLAAPALVAWVVGKFSRISKMNVLAVAYATLFVPVIGPAFGGTGSESPILFAALGLAGGLIWSIPYVLWTLIRGQKSGPSSTDGPIPE